MQNGKRSAIAISARAADGERTSVQKLYHSIACTKRQLSLKGTLSVQFRRIDVGNADLLCLNPNCVAIMDAVFAGT